MTAVSLLNRLIYDPACGLPDVRPDTVAFDKWNFRKIGHNQTPRAISLNDRLIGHQQLSILISLRLKSPLRLKFTAGYFIFESLP